MTHEENGWIRRAGRPVSFDGGCAYRGDHFDPDARIAAVSVVFVGNGCTKKRKERKRKRKCYRDTTTKRATGSDSFRL